MMGYNAKAERVYCDGCGKFMKYMEKGSSWALVPDSDMSYEELIDHCVVCTNKYGRPIPAQSVNLEACTGVYI